MKSDSSRFTFDEKKHYASVRMQQGRVLLDAEGTEQSDILNNRIETETKDVIGGCGGPMHNAAFEILGSKDELKDDEKNLAENKALLTRFRAPDFLIGKGRYYAGGILCLNEKLTSYLHQPDLPRYDETVPPVITSPGRHLVYVDVWQRLLTALDDPSIREVALGGPDTTARVKNVWQIKLWPIPSDEGQVKCNTKLPEFEALIAPGDGKMSARTKPPGSNDDPCIVPPGAGYTGLENQFYRIEIHDGGQVGGSRPIFELTRVKGKKNQVKVSGEWGAGEVLEFVTTGSSARAKKRNFARVVSASPGRGGTHTVTLDSDLSLLPEDIKARRARVTFKWSRDNGVVLTKILEIAGEEIKLQDLGPDDNLGFKAGQWVEISDDRLELNGLPGQMLQIIDVDPTTNLIKLSAAVSMSFPAALNPRVRRWDGFGAVDPSDKFVDLENSVQVQFLEGGFRTGDYWTVAARTATADAQAGNIEWPVDGGKPRSLLPFGIEHHYCRLAIATWTGEKFTIEDCRNLFPPVTELTTLLYINGAGQESMPGKPQPQALEVGVFNGRWPVAGATVEFTTSKKGKLASKINGLPAATFHEKVGTDPNGIASCAWMLDPLDPNNPDPDGPPGPSQVVTARLLWPDGKPTAQVVKFDGNLSLASEVFYDSSKCAELKADRVTTVQEAIDHLCKVHQGGCCDVTVGEGGEYRVLDEAIERLREQGRTDICICLLAGEHRVRRPVRVSDSPGKSPVTHLKISGCGLATRVVFEEGAIELDTLASFTLRDIAVSTTKSERLIRCTNVNEVSIDNCHLYALGPEFGIRPTLITIGGARFISIVGSTLTSLFEGPQPIQPVRDLDLRAFSTEPMAFAADAIADGLSKSTTQMREAFAKPYDALMRSDRVTKTERSIGEESIKTIQSFQRATNGQTVRLYEAVKALYHGNALVLLDSRADTLIENNRFTGRIMLYGNGDWVTQDEWKGIARRIQKGTATLVELGATLQIRNNLLTGISLDRRVIQNQDRLAGAYSRCLLSDNWCYAGWYQLVAAQLNITSNQFNWGISAANEAATVSGRSAVIIGNEAPNSGSELFYAVHTSTATPVSQVQAGLNVLTVKPLP